MTDPSRRNVLFLALALALGMAGSSLVITSAGIVGQGLASDLSLATMPIAFLYVASMLTTYPASLLMQRHGRKAGFVLGLAVGAAGALTATAGVVWQSFWLFCAGTFLLGSANSFVQYYRLAAADTASPSFKPAAISLVMAGGVLSALIGPNLARYSKDLLPDVTFAGTFLSLLVLQGLALIAILGIRIPHPRTEVHAGPGRPLREIARQPIFIAALTASTVGYALMTFLMTSTPLAVTACNYTFGEAAEVIQFHVLGMYLPAFVTGHIIRRIGEPRVILLGLLSYGAAVYLNTAGTDLYLNFVAGLFLLGVGWNFLYVGGSSLLTQSYRPEERARVQGLHDLVVFTAVALASLLSGSTFFAFGWLWLNALLLPAMALVVGALLLLAASRRAQGRVGA